MIVIKARKKPVEVEAIKTGRDVTIEGAMEFCKGNAYISELDNELYIKTLEGDMRVNVEDYIIKGVNGEYYPCKPDIFEKTYEIID